MKKFLLAAIAAVAILPSLAQSTTTLYPWEEGRKVLPKFSHMTLCYGGSAHRTPYLWPQNRMSCMVTCKDANGKEQWLFDSFLAIEFVDLQTAYGDKAYGFGGYTRDSADKASWQRLINYWFATDNGFDALNKAVGAAIRRIGEPPTKRTVVMTLPDPIMHLHYDDATSSATYWGELDGRQMNFTKAADRIAALKWYVNEVRERWNKANYQNIELLGFYIISEDLAIPGDGWSSELKHYEDIFPAISRYIHSCNEGVYWIPYYAAAPYKQWRKLGIDVAIMQPNMYWGDKPQYSFSNFSKMISTYGMGMELEFDTALLGSTTDALAYKERFREYLEAAKQYGIYGKKPFAVYSDTNAFYTLSRSTNTSDRKLYREICDFFLNDPLRMGGPVGINSTETNAEPVVSINGNIINIAGAAGGKCTVRNMLGITIASKNRLEANDAIIANATPGSVLIVSIEQNGKTHSAKLLAR